MKLIIDIDEERLETIRKYPLIYNSDEYKAIAHGIPYNPTGDLISREALKKSICIDEPISIDETWEQLYDAVVKAIDNAPTVEPERPQGEWITIKSPLSNETIVKCDKCGDEFIGNDVEDYNFCPICGATMKGGAE